MIMSSRSSKKERRDGDWGRGELGLVPSIQKAEDGPPNSERGEGSVA